MAKATATCTCKVCGKQFIKTNIYCHSRKEADEWEAWAVDNFDTCPDCYAVAQRKSEEEQYHLSALPALTGSDKQISWAGNIRKEMYIKFVQYCHNSRDKAADVNAFDRDAKSITDVFMSVTDARSYIDARYDTWVEFASKNYGK